MSIDEALKVLETLRLRSSMTGQENDIVAQALQCLREAVEPKEADES